MTTLIIAGLAVAGVIVLSWWLRRYQDFPSKRSEGEETHPEPGVHFRKLESPPDEPFD